MKNWIVIVKMSLVAIFFAITCIIPLIGPSLFSYTLANNGHFNQVAALSRTKLLAAMLLGIGIFTAMFELNYLPHLTTLIIFSLNTCFVVTFFFIGVYKRKRDDKKIVNNFA